MARMPGAEWVGPHHDNGSMSRYDIVCLHTIVGEAPAHAAHFSTRGDGHIYQSRDTAYRSAANSNGNARVIAIENADRDSSFAAWNVNDGHAVPAFTAAQVESLALICAWAYKTHGVPLVACPDSKPGSRGIAFHRQGIDGNWSGFAFGGRVAGGEVWTASRGKVCPGDRRIAQLPEIIARARVLAGLDAPQPTEEDEDMSVQFVKGHLMPAVFKLEFSHDGAQTAVRTWVPNEGDPGYRAFVACGGKVKTVPQDIVDGIPNKPGTRVYGV